MRQSILVADRSDLCKPGDGIVGTRCQNLFGKSVERVARETADHAKQNELLSVYHPGRVSDKKKNIHP